MSIQINNHVYGLQLMGFSNRFNALAVSSIAQIWIRIELIMYSRPPTTAHSLPFGSRKNALVDCI